MQTILIEIALTKFNHFILIYNKRQVTMKFNQVGIADTWNNLNNI